MGFQEAFKALSDPACREIINLLRDGKRSVGDTVSHLSSTNATVSHHPSIPKEAGLITGEKQGKCIYHELNINVIDEIISQITSLKGEE